MRKYIHLIRWFKTYNTRGCFASCVVFFRAPQGRGKMRAMRALASNEGACERCKQHRKPAKLINVLYLIV